MARTLRYLLVGIDKYQSPALNSLDGCVNDIEAFERYLKGRVASDDVKLEGKVLKNKEATRDGIIDGFRNHLAKANKGDIALFYYAGHGGQETTADEFRHLEPDGLNETLVTVESRVGEAYDLADKEIAKLLKEVEDTGAHVTVILDCCHSGSGVRDVAAKKAKTRRAPIDRRKRPLDSYLDGGKGLVAMSRSATRGAAKTSWPVGGYVLMAACRDSQEAKEYYSPLDDKPRGAFSYFLEQTLTQSDGRMTYRDVYERTNALVTMAREDQNPQFESADPAAMTALFLDGTVTDHSRFFFVSYDSNRSKWVMKGGAVNGVPLPRPGETMKLALFPHATKDDDLKDPKKAVGEAIVEEVQATFSVLKMPETLGGETSKEFKAVPTEFPVDKLVVAFEGDSGGIEAVRKALEKPIAGEKASQFVREANGKETPNYRLIAETSGGQDLYVVTRPGEDKALIQSIPGFTEKSALEAALCLAHIGRWFATLTLQNPTSKLKITQGSGENVNADVELRIYELIPQGDKKEAKLITEPEVRLEYRWDEKANAWVNPEIRIEVVNRTARSLHVALMNLTEQFGIFTELQRDGSRQLDLGQSFWAEGKINDNWTRDIPVFIKKDDIKNGVDEIRDILKLVVATEEFNIRLNQQKDLKKNLTEALNRGSTDLGKVVKKSRLENLLRKVRTRSLVEDDDDELVIEDWATAQFTFVTHRPLDAVAVAADAGTKELTGGVKLKPHRKLKAKVKLGSDKVASRSLGSYTMPPGLRDLTEGFEPFELIDKPLSRAAGSPVSVLEVSDIVDRSVVTPEEPLRLEVPANVGSDEAVIPVAFDGEFYLPVGYVKRLESGSEVVIERLPAAHASEALGEVVTRSVLGSVKIFFRKIKTNILGGDFDYPRLFAADVVMKDDKPTVDFDADIDSLKARVSKADRILILIHGVFGDCQSMRLGLHAASNGPKAAKEADFADLILAYDYESINTPIETIAQQLGGKLADLELKEGHGKKVTILCHSMGGLVSRYYLEKLGGDKVVTKLVMMGTPNGGSPWPSYQDWATTTLALGLNGLTVVGWPAAVMGVLSGIVGMTEKVDKTLDQMKPGSKFLESLAEHPAMPMPYSLIAGNTSLNSSALHFDDQEKVTLAQKLVLRLFSKPRLQGVFDLFFADVPNDIAVTVDSMKSMPKAWSANVSIVEVPCDHLSYFRHEKSQEKLLKVLE